MPKSRKTKKKSKSNNTVQIILAYADEPYLIFDVAPSEFHRAVEEAPDEFHQAVDAAKTPRDALRGLHNQLRDDLALMRDHADEIVLDDDRRNQTLQTALILLRMMTAIKGVSVEELVEVALNYTGNQSRADPTSPEFKMLIVPAPSEKTPKDVLMQASTARFFYRVDQ